MDRKNLQAYAAATVCVIIWGATFVVSKQLIEFMSPVQLMGFRFFIAFLTLWIIHPKWNFSWKKEIMFLGMGFFGNTLYFLAENTALTMTYTSNVSILASTTSIMSLALMALLHYEKVTKKTVAGFAVAFIGVVLIVLNGSLVLHLEPAGDMLALGAALAWAIYGLFLRRFTKEYNNFLISRKTMFYGFITTLPIILIENHPMDYSRLFTFDSIAGLLFLAVLGSCVCYIFWNNSIEKLGVVKSNMFLYFMPLVTLIVGAIVLDETVTLMAVAGIALVIAGMIVCNYSRSKNDENAS